VPDIDRVPDQPVSVVVRFFSDGFRTAPRNGFFYAKRQKWESAANPAVCSALRVQGMQVPQPYAPLYDSLVPELCDSPGDASNLNVWSSRQRADGYRITKFWWKAVLQYEAQPSMGGPPTDVRWSDDGSTVLVSVKPYSWYGATRVQIEGPAGLAPF
jgi:hypothetical protein